MNQSRIYCIIWLLLLTAITAGAQTNVLFLGNSYTGVNDLPSLVKQVAISAGDTIIVDSRTPGGRQIKQHAQDPMVFSMLRSKKWDYVVIQCQSQEPSLFPNYVSTNVFPYARALCDSIRKIDSCTVPMFYMTWGRKNGDASNCSTWPPVCTYEGMDSMLYMNYQKMGKDNNAEVSSVGAVWHRLRDSTNLELYHPDESHPSYVGSMAAAYTFYSAITRKNPHEATYQIGLKPSEAMEIKKAVEAVLYDNLDTFNIGIGDLKADFSYNQNECAFEFFGKKGFDSYLWDFGDGTASNAPSRTKTYQPGTYWVKLKTTRCRKTSIDSQQVSCTVLGIDNSELSSGCIQPNPTNGSFSLPVGFSIKSVHTLEGKQLDFKAVSNNSYKLTNQLSPQLVVLHLINQKNEHVYTRLAIRND
jgi:hypothetical protein